MAKKFRENFFILLISNTVTVLLVLLLPMLLCGSCNNDRNSTELLQSFSLQNILYCMACVLAVCLISSVINTINRDIVINNNINPQLNTSVKIQEKADEIREHHRRKEEDAQNLLYKCIKGYTYDVLTPYMTDEALENLCQNIKLFDIPDSVMVPVITDKRLSTLDLRHYAWNIGERLGWSGQKRATFIKLSFPDEMEDLEIETIRRNLRFKGKCIIQIDIPENKGYEFHR